VYTSNAALNHHLITPGSPDYIDTISVLSPTPKAPSSLLSPTLDAIVLSTFPIAWFFGFFYYTEVPSLVFVVWTIVAASQGNHWLAGLVRVFQLI
jgi:hypothetical protein